MIPAAVLAVWDAELIRPLTAGLINQTFLCERGDEKLVIQGLHPVFGASVNIDIEAVTHFLRQRGLNVPELLRNLSGELWFEHEGVTWRAQSFLMGETHPVMRNRATAYSAGSLVGRMHCHLKEFQHTYQFVREGVHDTRKHMGRLQDASTASKATGDRVVTELAEEILALEGAIVLPTEMPLRHCHGDLKVTNLLFRDDDAIAIVDWDTCGRQPLAFELGDALRSWANPLAEDASAPRVDRDIVAGALQGFCQEIGDCSLDEVYSIVDGFFQISLELAARFCADAHFDEYFGWDSARYHSRRQHNLARATSQLLLAKEVKENRAALRDIAEDAYNTR